MGKIKKFGRLAMLILASLGGLVEARLNDLNDEIKANLQDAEALHAEMLNESQAKGPIFQRERSRIVVEEEKSSNIVAKAPSERFKFKREKRRPGKNLDERNRERLATELGQFQGQ